MDALWRRDGLDAIYGWAMAVHGWHGLELGKWRALGLAPLSLRIMGQCSGNRLGMVAGRRNFLEARDGKLGQRK